jgi:hypothetical protein
MTGGYDQTWIDTDDLRIMTCRLTCGFVQDLTRYDTL